jgi:sugar lactone lactonase YvrE
VVLSPDDRFAALKRSMNLDGGGIVVFPLGGGAAVPVTGTGRVAQLVGWHPSDRLLYTSDRSGGAIGIWAIPVREGKLSGEPELVHGRLHSQNRPWLGRDGALHYEDWYGPGLVQTATLDTAAGTLSGPKPATKLFTTGWAPDFSADGKFLMYATAYSPGTVKFVIQDLASGRETAYPAPFLTVLNQVLWSPDGSALLAPALMDRAQEQTLYRFVPATGEAKPLVKSEGDGIARDGRYAYVVEKGKPGVQRVDLATGERKEVALPGSPRPVWPVAVTPDGSGIAYAYAVGGSEGASMARTIRLAVASLSGGGETVIAEHPIAEWRFGIAAGWTPDRRTLYSVPLRKAVGFGMKSKAAR